MDVTMETVSRLYLSGDSMKKISKKIKISESKVKKILITLELYHTPLSDSICADIHQGLSVSAMAYKYGLSKQAISANMAYIKGIYGAEYPSINAIRIQNSRKISSIRTKEINK